MGAALAAAVLSATLSGPARQPARYPGSCRACTWRYTQNLAARIRAALRRASKMLGLPFIDLIELGLWVAASVSAENGASVAIRLATIQARAIKALGHGVSVV